MLSIIKTIIPYVTIALAVLTLATVFLALGAGMGVYFIWLLA